jgi:hypothetical protein
MQGAAGNAAQRGAIDLTLRLGQATDGRLEGTLQKPGQTENVQFSGTLDLLRALEAALDESPAANAIGGQGGEVS